MVHHSENLTLGSFLLTDYIAQLYMVAKASQEESGQQVGEGVEIIRNEPFDATSPINEYNMPPGQYTYVFFFFFSKSISASYYIASGICLNDSSNAISIENLWL